MLLARLSSHDGAGSSAGGNRLPDVAARASATDFELQSVTPLSWQESLVQLRRAGVPSAIIAKLVTEKVALKWNAREEACERQYLQNEIDEKRIAELQVERASEEEQELRAALGDDYLAWDKERVLRGMLLGGFVPSLAQKDALYAIQKSWLGRLKELEAAHRDGRLDAAAFDAAYTRAESEYKAQLAAIVGASRVDGPPPVEEPTVQVRREFGRLSLTASQFADLASTQQTWSKMRRELAASVVQNGSTDAADEDDLRTIDDAREAELRRILGEDAFRVWHRSRDASYRVLQSDPQFAGLDAVQLGRVYDAVRDYDIAASTLRHNERMREFSGQAPDQAAIDQARAILAKQTKVSLCALLGRERYERMQKDGLFGLPDLDLAQHDLHPVALHR